MGTRRKARELVLQALYEAEFSDPASEGILGDVSPRGTPAAQESVEYARELVSQVLRNLAELDRRIEGALENWEFDRVSLVDKNILRLALAEILFFPQVPSKVIINEAIEIAHKYSSHEAGQFVNGILDRFVQEYRGGVA